MKRSDGYGKTIDVIDRNSNRWDIGPQKLSGRYWKTMHPGTMDLGLTVFEP
jgi:hypothetical protein